MTQATPVDNPSTETPTQTATVTPAAEFAKKREERLKGKVITLPSGVSVRVRRPSINNLIASGHVPSDVAAVLMSGQSSQAVQGTKEFSKLVQLQKIVAKHAVIEPKIVDGEPNYGNGEIAIEDFTDEDLTSILIFVQSGVADLGKFRKERAS